MARKTLLSVFSIVGCFLSWCLVSFFLLLYGNDWWLSGLTTLTVFVWLAGLLVLLFQQGRVRAAATGAVIAAATYWLLALGPWFGANVGPTLLTSRLLTQADVMLHGSPQQLQAITWAAPQPYASTGNIFLTGSPGGNPNTTFIPATQLGFATTAVTQGSSVFQPLGHWLLIWLCAGVGGLAALLMLIRSERQQSRANPYAAAASPGVAP